MLSYHTASKNTTIRTPQTAGFSRYEGSSLLAVSSIVGNYTWSPILFKDNYRAAKNFEASYYVALDFESPDYPLEAAIHDFCDCKHVIGTTDNHQKWKGDEPPRDRFRVLIPWAAPITDVAVYIYNMQVVMDRYDCDKSCKDAARHFFRCRQIVSVNSEGYHYDVETPDAALIASRKQSLDKKRAYAQIGILGLFAKRWLTQEIPVGLRNKYCYVLGCELARVGLDFEDALSRVLSSPTYLNMYLGEKLHFEIAEAVWNGFVAEGAVDGKYKDYLAIKPKL